MSDTLASALWVTDMMCSTSLHSVAQVSTCMVEAAVSIHPLPGVSEAGFHRRPEYFGIALTRQFLGSTLVRCSLECSNDRIRAYAAQKAGARLVIFINKTLQPATIRLPLRHARRQWLLYGPSIDAKEGTAILEGARKFLA